MAGVDLACSFQLNPVRELNSVFRCRGADKRSSTEVKLQFEIVRRSRSIWRFHLTVNDAVNARVSNIHACRGQPWIVLPLHLDLTQSRDPQCQRDAPFPGL